MDDLEPRLRDSLNGVAGRSPHPPDLAAGARARLRRRRRTSVGVVATALAVVAVPVGLVLGGDGSAPDRRDPDAVDSVPGDWRVETYRDLTLRVPPEWRWGGGADWCTSGRPAEETTPQVSRPGGMIPTVACAPGLGYGAHLGGAGSGPLPPGTEGVVQQYTGERYPDGAWLGYAATSLASVWVVTDSRRLTRQVLDTVSPVGSVDANGCAVRVPAVAASGDDRVSICRYEAGVLQQSELLSVEDSAAAVEAVQATGAPGPGARVACPPSPDRRPGITLQSAALDARLLPSRACGLSAVFLDDGEQRLVTAEVLRWALSPGWSGVLRPGLPAPERFRTQ